MIETLCLTRHDPARNMARFYRLQIAPDLFGGAVLIRQWGRIGTQGHEHRHWLPDLTAAEAEAQDWLSRKLRRGYAASA
jgi:predicted DNA-binding WGR domain protein